MAGAFSIGEWQVAPSLRTLTCGDRQVHLEPKVMRVLEVLAGRAGAVVSKDELLQTVWPDTFVGDEVLARTISELRRALGDDAKSPRYIHTVPKGGYRLVAPVALESPVALAGVAHRKRPTYLPWVWAVAAFTCVAAVLWRSHASVPPPAPAMVSVPLTAFVGAESMPTFSPDGSQVAFVWDGEKQDNRDIYVKSIGGGPPLRLTTDTDEDLTPAWSPDGSAIAFIRQRQDAYELRMVPALGGPDRKLADMRLPARNAYNLRNPLLAWSPDGEWLLFPTADPPEQRWGVAALSVKTGERRILTTPPRGSYGDSGIAVSPDGRQLAFIRVRNLSLELCVLQLSMELRPTGDPRVLPSGDLRPASPAWTPDGTEIVFAGLSASWVPRGLWRVAASGSHQAERLPSVGDNVGDVAVSRRGHRLVYALGNDDTNIWRLELSPRGPASGPVRLITSTQGDLNAQYSPDGSKIAFASSRSGNIEIWICDADGTKAVQVTSFEALSGTPRWSPDGRRIVFDSNKEGRFQLYVADAAGGVPQRITNAAADDAAPSFSRDGTRIYFASLRTGRWEVWRMPATGGSPTQVTHTGGFAPFESADGRTLYYQKLQGLSDVWTVPVNGGEERKLVESVGHRQFAVRPEGIYCIRATEQGSRLQLFDFAAHTVKDLAAMAKQTDMGLAVSPDGRYVLYTQVDEVGSDLIVGENFW